MADQHRHRRRLTHPARCIAFQNVPDRPAIVPFIDECGCGKNLLYTHFASKDEPIVAYLGRCREWEAIINRGIQEAGDDPGHPAHQVSVGHFEALRRQLVGLAARAGLRDAPGVAERILLIVYSLYSTGAVLGRQDAVPSAIALAEQTIRAGTGVGAAIRGRAGGPDPPGAEHGPVRADI